MIAYRPLVAAGFRLIEHQVENLGRRQALTVQIVGQRLRPGGQRFRPGLAHIGIDFSNRDQFAQFADQTIVFLLIDDAGLLFIVGGDFMQDFFEVVRQFGVGIPC